jgi:hypothetical protein
MVARRNARGGRSAEEHLVAALRCLYRRAVDDGLIAEADNPARKVAKPRRLPTTRRALPDTRLAEINEVAARTGDDPELDTLILRLHSETACRRGGALALRPASGQTLDTRAGHHGARLRGEPTLEIPGRTPPRSHSAGPRHGQAHHVPRRASAPDHTNRPAADTTYIDVVPAARSPEQISNIRSASARSTATQPVHETAQQPGPLPG